MGWIDRLLPLSGREKMDGHRPECAPLPGPIGCLVAQHRENDQRPDYTETSDGQYCGCPGCADGQNAAGPVFSASQRKTKRGALAAAAGVAKTFSKKAQAGYDCL